MSSINITKMVYTKIYKVDNVLVDNRRRPKVLNNVYLGHDVDSMLSTFGNLFKAVPNNIKQIYRSSDNFAVNTFALKPATQVRLDYYTELRDNRIPFKIIKTPEDINTLDTKSNVIMDFSNYYESYNLFVLGKKKSVQAQFPFLVNMINHIKTQLPKKANNQFIIDVSDINAEFLKCFQSALSVHTKELFDLFNGYNVYFSSATVGLVYKADLSSINKKSQVKSLLDKLLLTVNNISDSNNTYVDDPDIEYIKPDQIQGSDKELFDASLEFSGELSSTEDPVDDNNTSNELEDDNKSKVIPEEEKNTEENEDILGDLDVILDTSVDIAEEKLKQENADFLNKMLPVQEKVLSAMEKEAEELAKDKTLDVLQIKDDTILNPNVKSIVGSSITNSYYKKQFKSDVLKIIKSLNKDSEHPVVVTNFTIKDNSTALSKLQEFNIEFTDKKMRKHNFVVDVPILSHDGFLYINGNMNFIAKQAVLLPVIKESNERVQITTNYRKTFLYRKGDKINGQLDRLTRILTGKDFDTITKKYGNSYNSNLKYNVSIPYNYLAKQLYSLTFDTDYTIVFCQEDMQNMLKDHNIKIPLDKYIGIGYRTFNGKIVTIIAEEYSTRKIHEFKYVGGKTLQSKTNASFVEYLTQIVENSKDELLGAVYRSTKPSISLSYTEVKILSSSVSLGAMAASFKGILPLLQEFNIEHTISDTRRAKTNSEIIVPFKNAYLYIDTKFDPATELLVNGLLHINTKSYKIEESTRMSPMFLEYYQDSTGSRNSAKGLLNFESSFIDPIVLEVLQTLNLPTDFISLLIYGNTLLGDYNRDRKNDMNHFRVRDSEVISVALYNSLVDSFNTYKKTTRSGIPLSINVKRDDVIRKLQTMNNVEGYSTLNPVLEAEIKSKTTFKGPSGLTI